jgi:antirestriction protein ArdC
VKADIYQTITERFVEQLRSGTVPWQKPWLGVQNLVSQKPYRGINSLLLGSTDYQSPYWATFKQVVDLGGLVKKGEKSTPIIYYKILEKRDDAGKLVIREDGRPTHVPFVRWSNVFNLEQTEGITPPNIPDNQVQIQCNERRPQLSRMPSSVRSITPDLRRSTLPAMTLTAFPPQLPFGVRRITVTASTMR